MKGVAGLLVVLFLTSFVMAASTSSFTTEFNVVDNDSSENGIGISGEDLDTTNYGFYWIALVVVVGATYIFWKLSKRKTKKNKSKK